MASPRKHLESVLIKPAGPDCNMECAYCFYLEKSALYPGAKTHRMSSEVLEEIVRQVMSQPITTVSFGWQGGEPTLMGLPFFEKAVELQKKYGRGHSVGNGLQTNGLLIDGEWAGFLKKYSFLVGLSLDGPEHVHDHYRFLGSGRGSWSRVRESARLMLDAGVSVNALATVNDHSVRFPEESYRFFKEIGLTFMQFIPVVERDAAGHVAPFSAPPDRYGEFLCTLFDLWLADFEEDAPATSVRFFDSVFHTYAGVRPPECTLLEECGVYVAVEHNGDVYSCDFFVEPGWKLGNVREGALVEMLNSTLQNRFGREKARLPSRCGPCPWLKYCRGGCPKDHMPNRAGSDPNHFCSSFEAFFEHAHERLLALAEKWKENQAKEREAGSPARAGGPDGAKIGRNDPCPCGSGRKYKKCCGGKT